MVSAEDDASPAEVLEFAKASGDTLVVTVRTAPPEVRAFHPTGMTDPAGFAALGCVETLLHGQDIARGLGLDLDPPRQVCAHVLASRSARPAHTNTSLCKQGGHSGMTQREDECSGQDWALSRRPRGTGSLCDDEQMSPRVPTVDAASLAAWCTDHLGSAPAVELFRSGHLSAVIGLRLADMREVVVKVRPTSPRIAACVEVQRRMFESGYPCPEPLGGPGPFGNGVATAEVYVPGGDVLPGAEHAAQLSAEAFARLIGLAPRSADVSSLDPAPSWAAWNHGEAGLWPRPEGAEVDLNEVDGPEWIDRAAGCARDRLRAGVCEVVIGHCDWLADNLRWRGDELLVVHDWDSAVADSEAVLVGFAAALYSSVSPDELATVEETDRFLDAYCDARGRAFSADELQRSWAAGVWTRAYDAKYQHVAGHAIASLSETEAHERLRRAGID